MKASFKVGWKTFYPLWKEILEKSSLEKLQKIRGRQNHLSAKTWTRIVYDYLVAHQINRKIDTFFFISSLVPLYQLRTASFVEEAESMNNQQAEDLIEDQAKIFEELKPYLLRNWDRKVLI